jgi:hypothetical protein|tara:strand:+ start:12302 stop:12913 length:612 start_codon:yes stop_codon:yes gene_type:complete
MSRRCPPGVLCIENMTIIFLLSVIGLVVLYMYYASSLKSSNKVQPVIIENRVVEQGFFPKFNKGFSNHAGNVLLNPFVAPLKNNGYFPPDSSDPRGVPINIRTRGYNTNYSQTGLLTRVSGKETMLPLMGRPLHTNRNKWQYYTMSDKNNSIKLPVSRNGRSCTNEYGCDELFNGDTIYVEGYNDAFKVVIYETNEPRYIPYL